MKLVWLNAHDPFPNLNHALTEPNGLLAASKGLSATRVLEAYRQGIFPWYGENQPVLWWSPNPRTILVPEEIKVSGSMRKTIRQAVNRGRIKVSSNLAFTDVLGQCASTHRPGQNGTWIVDEIVEAYTDLHALGRAHSIEVWEDDALVAGLYGVQIGAMFFGESMFTHRADRSKIALIALASVVHSRGGRMIDCQQRTNHLISLGAKEISRALFIDGLRTMIQINVPDWPVGFWDIERVFRLHWDAKDE